MVKPVYVEIHDDIQKKIENNIWSIGKRIPSERILSDMYNVSRMTLRQAIQILVEEGILNKVPGSGTYVANQKIQEKMSGVTGFTDIMISEGKVPSSKTLLFKEVDATFNEAEELKINNNDKVLRMERIRYGDQIPICYEITTIRFDLLKGISKDEISRSLYQSLNEKKGLKPKNAKQYISAILATNQISEYLDINANDPVLKLRQTSYLDDGTPFEYVQSQYAAERFEFYLQK